MKAFFVELIKTLGTAAIVVAAFAWVAKSVITHFLSRKIEAYKLELKNQSDKETERLRSRLQIIAQERQITFSRLHEKRAEIVADSYPLIHKLQSKAVKLGHDMFFSGLREPKDKAKQIFDECFEFYEYFQERRIYFSEEVCAIMDRFVEVIAEANSAVRNGPDNLDHGSKAGQEAYSKMAVLMDQLPEIRKSIERDFRTLLGVTTPSNLHDQSSKRLQ
jgi:hypothetical protein